MEIGEKIKQLRLRLGLTQEELADRCELSKGFISQVERDLTSPSIATLVDILQGLGTTPRQFFAQDKAEPVVFAQSDMFVKPDPDDRTGAVTWLVPNAQGNTMEPILASLAPGGETSVDDPHEGEEFGYVLSGAVDVKLGGASYRAKAGDSFYFRPSSEHSLANAGKSVARVLWISTPPSF
ncbi:MAG: cupin domain-containing protein [Oscillospiraceae bacterium]|jgi:transcriptional regulator with XRE-family HTH domain|nr:cupin domain-containing protein [Oscillospiraceae bacterium]